MQIDFVGANGECLQFDVERRLGGRGSFPASSWFEEVRKLVDGEDSLLSISLKQLG